MIRITAATEQLQRADSLPAVLDASCEAFQEILTVLRAHEDDASPWLIAFVMAATSAAEGRDAVLFAPALPTARLHKLPDAQEPADSDATEVAEAVAALAAALAGVLVKAANSAADPRDRDACRRAATRALDIQRQLTGTGP